MPIEPAPSKWQLPSERDVLGAVDDVVATGADLEPGTILAAYRSGLFPMHLDPAAGGRVLGWWSPDPRGVIPLDGAGMRVTKSLRKSCAKFEIRINTAFDDVIGACADPNRNGRWILRSIRDAYSQLHELGWVHSVEAWSVDDGTLAGGLYGVAIGGLFAGESMFHRRRDASKVALVGLVDLLQRGGAALLDVQWATPHLTSLGAVEIPRPDYLRRLASAITQPHIRTLGNRQLHPKNEKLP